VCVVERNGGSILLFSSKHEEFLCTRCATSGHLIGQLVVHSCIPSRTYRGLEFRAVETTPETPSKVRRVCIVCVAWLSDRPLSDPQVAMAGLPDIVILLRASPASAEHVEARPRSLLPLRAARRPWWLA
jgi:hypothetical protein